MMMSMFSPNKERSKVTYSSDFNFCAMNIGTANGIVLAVTVRLRTLDTSLNKDECLEGELFSPPHHLFGHTLMSNIDLDYLSVVRGSGAGIG